jgi:hypothetical protein
MVSKNPWKTLLARHDFGSEKDFGYPDHACCVDRKTIQDCYENWSMHQELESILLQEGMRRQTPPLDSAFFSLSHHSC